MSQDHIEDHSSLIKTPRQLVITVVLAFVIPITLILLIVKAVTVGIDTSASNPVMSDEAIAKRIRPVGEVVLAQGNGGVAMTKSGEEVYKSVCAACHGSGALGAPKVGDKAAWGKLMGKGLPGLTKSAIAGVRQMPARGGNPDLSDTEVGRGIAYMVNQSGGQVKEPLPPTPKDKPVGRSGEQVVTAACGKCHDTGAGGAPKVGDKAAWTPRVSKGLNTMTESAIKGHGGMPARGGMADITDVEVRRAIEYMFNAGGGAPGAATAAGAPAAAAPGKPDGKAVYTAACAACHAAGIAGAPKAGDKAAWAPRLKTGMDALYASSLKGKGAMPAKGGNASLSDADVKAAVDYLSGLAK
jgi:cytochrome c5